MKGGQLVREARRRAGITQAELARRTGTTQSAIARIERGAVAPSLERIVQLVGACGFDLDAHLVAADDADWRAALTNRTLTPTDRVRQMLAFRRLAMAGRAAMAEERGRGRTAGG